MNSSTSTLSGASVETAEGNDFINIGGNMVKLENVILTVNTHCATEDDNAEVRKNPRLGPILDRVGTLLDCIIKQKASETNPISSANIHQQSAPDCDARDHSEPITEMADMISPASSSASDTSNSTVSSLPQPSFPERYIRSMLECNEGHPLYEPDSESQEGVRVGDVGLITENGGFDFLFNVCPPSDISTNPDELPDDFETLRYADILVKAHFQSDTRIFNDGVERTEEPDVKYTCSGPEGGILELPSGATRFEAKNKLSFKWLATRHAENWYRYTVLTKEKEVSNGSLYIVTSCIKCTDWGIAVFNRPSNPQDYLRFITNLNGQSKYRWKGSGSYIARVAENRGVTGSNDADGLNQCVFLRGYKIMLPKDIWDNITNSQLTYVTVSRSRPYTGNKSESPRQGDSSNQGGPSQSRADNGPGSDYGTTRAAQNTCIRTDTSACVILYEYSKTSPTHPSDLINAMLLCQEPKAKVALTHDDDWCDLLQFQQHAQILGPGAIAKVGLPYTSNVDEYGCASLKRSDLSSNITVGESSSNTRVTSTLENHLPIDSDNLTLVRQDVWYPFNATIRPSTPHSQCSHHSISSITAAVGSDVNRVFACEHSIQASGVPCRYPYSIAGAGSSGQPTSPQKTVLDPHLAGSDGPIPDGTHSPMLEEEDDESSEHDYISSQDSTDIELRDAADKFYLSCRRDEVPGLDYLLSLPIPAKREGGPYTTSTAIDQSDKSYQFRPGPSNGNEYLQSDFVHFPDSYASYFWNLSSQSPVGSPASGPTVVMIEDVKDNIKAVGSPQMQQAAGKRRKKVGVHYCPFRNTGCQTTFTAPHNLRYHINAHLGIKPYKCNTCPYAATAPSTLKRHQRTCRVQVDPQSDA